MFSNCALKISVLHIEVTNPLYCLFEYIGYILGCTIMDKIYEANPSFHMKQHNTEKF